MNICEAAKMTGNGSGIYRESNPTLGLIIPTNTEACCIIGDPISGKSMFRWNPTLGDLTADDWQPTGLSGNELRKERADIL